MTAPALVTIGITCFNARDTIARAIESALAQDYPNIEILVVDDCSTDSSAAIAAGYPGVRLVPHAENLGVAAARNTIIAEAKGEFIAFFDDDDVSLPTRLSAQVARLTAEERAQAGARVVCHMSGWTQYPNGYRAAFRAIGSDGRAVAGADLVACQLYMPRPRDVFFGNGTPACSMMARKETLLAAGGFDPDLRRNEDTELSIRLGSIGCLFVGCAEPLLLRHASEGPDKAPATSLASELAILAKHRALMTPSSLYDFAVSWTYVRHCHYSGKRLAAIARLWLLFLRFPVHSVRRFLRAAPARLWHEARMSK